jgi:solute carrier family 25 (mitochondrial oxoglutarate transporter), member 11
MAETIKPYFCGGFSACFASLCVHPIDLVKVRLQILPAGSSIMSVGGKILAEEGAKGLYAGLSASITRQATYGTARIGLHAAFSKELKERNGGKKIPMWQTFLSSFCSGAIASSIGNPFDVSLVRMQADSTKPLADRKGYTGVGNAISRIVKEEGFSALYRGYPPTLLRAICMNVGQLMTYDISKDAFASAGLSGTSLNLSSAAAAGFACAFLSLPPDMVKTRLQNMQPDPKTGLMPYKGVVDCFTKIAREEGVLRFWAGFGAYYARCAPHAMIILMVREEVIKVYNTAFGLQK